MHKIIAKKRVSPQIIELEIEAPAIAGGAKPGQFIILRIDEYGERIPLTVVSTDKERGTIRIIFQEAGRTTKKLAGLSELDCLSDLLGPLGKATDFGKVGKIVLVAGGVGAAEVVPIAKYARDNLNEVYIIVGAKTKELIILEDELKAIGHRLWVTTDDGSYGTKGLVTDLLRQLLDKEKFDLSYAVGPDIMMKAVCELTKIFGLKTIVSLDANMVDATGMCGTCRVTVGGETKFTCVDGPEFDGHKVEWDEFMRRQKRFLEEESQALKQWKPVHKECRHR